MSSAPPPDTQTMTEPPVGLTRHRGLLAVLALAGAGLALCLTDAGRDQLTRTALIIGSKSVRVMATRRLLTCPSPPATEADRRARASRIDAALVRLVLSDPDGRVRDTGLVALESWGRRSRGAPRLRREISSPLVSLVCDGRSRDAYVATRLLRSRAFGELTGGELRPLLALAESERTDLELDRRCLAIQLLGFLAPSEPEVLSTLARIIVEGGPLTASAAAEALGLHGDKGRVGLDALRRALASNDSELRAKAAEALGAIGPAAAPAVDELLTLLGDPESVVRVQAIRALGSIGVRPDDCLPKLEEVLIQSRDVVERQSAITSLGDFGPAARALLPRLRSLQGEGLFEAELEDAIQRMSKQKSGGAERAEPGSKP